MSTENNNKEEVASATTTTSTSTTSAEAAPAPPALKITCFTLYYDAPGGCFASDRMRDTWPQWEKTLKEAGITVKLQRSYGSIPNLDVAAELSSTGAGGGGGGGSTSRTNVWKRNIPESDKNAQWIPWSYPWDMKVSAALVEWARSGIPPAEPVVG